MSGEVRGKRLLREEDGRMRLVGVVEQLTVRTVLANMVFARQAVSHPNTQAELTLIIVVPQVFEGHAPRQGVIGSYLHQGA